MTSACSAWARNSPSDRAQSQSRQLVEGAFVSAYELASARDGSGSDDEVVRAALPASTSDVGQETRVHTSDVDVVALDGNRTQDRLRVCRAARPAAPIGELHPDEELGDGDGRNRHVVGVADLLLERRRIAFRSDEN